MNHLFYRYILPIYSFLFFGCLITSALSAQPTVEWGESYGGTLNDIPNSTIETPDGGYLVVGQSTSADEDLSANKGNYDLWVLKTDSEGNILWEKNYGGSKDEYGMQVQPSGDGGFIIVGGSNSSDGDLTNNSGRSDVWVLKINATGTLVWSKTYGGSGVDIGTAFQITNQGKIIVAACTGSAGESGVEGGMGGNDYWVLQLDESGDLEWQKTYGGSRHDAAKTITLTEDGGYLIGGNSWSTNGDVNNSMGLGDVWLLKIDAAGNVVWSKNYGSDLAERMNDLVKDTDGNFVFIGMVSDLTLTGNGFGGRYDENFWITKVAPDGQELWSKNYGGKKYDEAFAIQTAFDGGYLVGGAALSEDEDLTNNNGQKDMWLLKLNEGGELVWQKSFGGTQNEVTRSLLETADGGILLTGFSNSIFVDTIFQNIGLEDWWLVKLRGTAIEVDLGLNQNGCVGEAFTLDAYIPDCDCTYLWNDGNTDSIRQVTVNATTLFSVTVTDQNGVEGIGTVSIFTSQPEVAAQTNNICFGATNGAITLTPQEVYNYSWSNGATTQNISDLPAGSYTVTATNINGCEWIETIEITSSPAITFSENIQDVACFGDNTGSILVSGTGGTGTLNYMWNTGETSNSIQNLEAGDYTVTILDVNSCSTTTIFSIEENTAIELTAVVEMVDCFDTNTGLINLSVNGGASGFDYLWSTMASTQDINSLSAGSYTVTVIDEVGCEVVDNWVVTNPAEITIVTTPIASPCFGSADGGVQTITAGGTGDLTYEWSNGVITSDLENVVAGTYTLTVTDDNLCEKTSTVIIDSPAEIIVDAVVDPASCSGNNDGSISTIVEGGVGLFEFDWSTGATTPNLSMLGSGTYTITVTDQNLCEQVKEIVVSQNTDMVINSAVEQITCYGATDGAVGVAVNGGTGELTYLWNTMDSTQSIVGLAGGDYILTVTDENGCEAVELFSIVMPDPLAITSSVTSVSCFGGADGAIDITVSGGTGVYAYQWSVGASSGLTSDTYIVTVTDENNCQKVTSIFVSEPAELTADFQINNPINGMDGSILVIPEGGTAPYEYSWNNGMWTGDEITGLSSGNYNLVMTDANECQYTTTVFLAPVSVAEIENLHTFDVFPNPNDGDFFLKIGFEEREQAMIVITNELGQVIRSFEFEESLFLEKTNLSQVAAGIYFVMVRTKNGVAVKRVVVTK